MTLPQCWPKVVPRFFVALLFGVILGSLIQTQLNLLALQALGLDIPLGVRLQTSLQDLLNFAPVYGIIFGASFVLSQAAALALGWRLEAKHWQPLLCALAAGLGLWLALSIVNALAPMPTLIAATRSPEGLAAILASAALAGWLLGRLLTRVAAQASHSHSALPLVGCLLVLSMLLPAPALQAQQPVPYQIETLTDGLEHPWSLAFLPDGQMLVTERPGRLRLISADGELREEPVSGLPPIFVSGQSGLKDIALVPNFAEYRLLYLSYSCGSARANHTCLLRARLTDEGLEDVEEVFRTQPAKSGDAHYGGRLTWLPDHTLILTLGDGFDYREQAQNLNNHLGTLVRLNPDGSAPRDNPFVGQSGIQPEIYSYGHRNVQGLVYDHDQRRLIAHEHGPRGGDELNIITPGSNYGWPLVTHGLDYTGARVTPYTELEGMHSPKLQWTPSIAPSGMTLYKEERFPQWQGSLLIGALAARQVHRVELDATPIIEEILFAELDERIRDVRTGPQGAVYLLTDSPEGRLLRVTPEP